MKSSEQEQKNISEDQPWAHHADSVIEKFSGHREHGLDHAQVQSYQAKHGKNKLLVKGPVGKFTLFINQFKNPMAYTLLGAAFIATYLNEFLDTLAIFAILLLNAMIGFFQEIKADTAILALKKLTVPKARVVREGKLQEIPSEEVVPGDIVHLEAGDYVPADLRVIEAYQLSVDESPLTGESLPVRKDIHPIRAETILAERNNMLHSGTAVSSGSSKGVVVRTGMKTEMGQIANLLDITEIQETPLQKRLNVVTKNLIILGVIVIFLVMVIYYLKGESWSYIFISAISLAVAAIPEGLPTVVTLALALAVRRMTKRHAIVRKIAAVETLGSTDVICTDKTGTLTTGVMSVRETFLIDRGQWKNFLEALILCNNASLHGKGSGDTTERALLKFAKDEGESIADVKERFPRIHEWSFDSNRKRMSVGINTSDGVRIITKGSPESMIGRCRLNKESLKRIEDEIQHLTSQGKRLLAVGEKIGTIFENADEVEKELNFLGLVAMADPPRIETTAAIKECKDSGIKVVMITGDHPATAKAIALELGIVTIGEFDQVLTGKELDELDIDSLKERVEKTAVYARVSPTHKLKIVEALQREGHVVAMTGDGVNDAPALKKAQIGISMGKGGTEVARQASGMILTDDNFSTIVSAVEEGRAIYGNIRRTIQYLLSTNLAEILIVLGASLMSLPIPFTPIGLLWINLVTDGLPSLALAAEPLDKNILQAVRRPSPSKFFDQRFLVELFLTGVLITLLCLGFYHHLIQTVGQEKARSLTFTLLVYMSLFRSFTCRSETKTFFELKVNYYHLGAILLPIFFQYWIHHLPVFEEMFGVGPLEWREHLVPILLALIPPTIIEMTKLGFRFKKGSDA